jgi:hypothetical protein
VDYEVLVNVEVEIDMHSACYVNVDVLVYNGAI